MAKTYCLKDFCKDSKCFAFNEAEKGNQAAKLYCINHCQAYAFQQYIDQHKARIVSFEENDEN